jgi:hypothetical protein
MDIFLDKHVKFRSLGSKFYLEDLIIEIRLIIWSENHQRYILII